MDSPMKDWSREDVSTLPGIGPKIREKLERLGIYNKQQLLFHLPIRYEDRTRISPIGSLQPGQRVLIEGDILQTGAGFRSRGRSRRQLLVKLSDDTGLLTLRFFHFNASQQARLQQGTRLRCFGEVRLVMGGLEMIHPEYQMLAVDSAPPPDEYLTPVYPTTEGLHQLGLRRIMAVLIRQLQQHGLRETLPESWLQQHDFPEVTAALQVLHNPRSQLDVDRIQQYRHPAQLRFIIEELTAHRISLLLKRQHISRMLFPQIGSGQALVDRFIDKLDFELTAAQQRVVSQLLQDYQQEKPMMRLVQGDVGSGKTVVAAIATLPVLQAGYQCALMAPTEILAEQHFRNFRYWLELLGIQVVSLMGADKGRKRQHKESLISSGEAQVVIGTHALFQASVNFHRLGLVIIDEQHRFGVDQRQALQKKAGQNIMPHQLIMTATPIPRTLAMSIYADLDYSQIDELPPGRTPVKTSIIAHSQRPQLIDSVRKACDEGQQIYWVCTLIEESESLQCQAAEETFSSLRQQLSGIEIGLVHGRMKAADKEAAIDAFKKGATQLLVATTVIEVGVDVPNASIMIIENPERLGLSQIHQLRGRVGRGNKESFCILLVKNDLSKTVTQRLEILRNHQDGFIIAEKDLEIRGAGEVLGTRQTGEASFHLADLVRDQHWFEQARHLAEILMQDRYQNQRQQLLENWIGQRVQYSDVG
jgi:ATP-dependent DNA helicase RecG